MDQRDLIGEANEEKAGKAQGVQGDFLVWSIVFHTPNSNYAFIIMKHLDPIGKGMSSEVFVVPSQIKPIRLLESLRYSLLMIMVEIFC